MRNLLVICVLAAAAPTLAQEAASGLSGTWVLQADAGAARGRRPVNGISIATRLVIRQSPADVIVDSNTGTANSIVTTTYRLDGAAHTIPGPIGWDTRATSQWDGSRLMVSIRRSVQGPDGELTFDITEVYSAADDTLTLERTQGKTVETLVYKR